MIGTILWALIAGTVIGVIARLILPGRQNISTWATIAVGVAAALIGGALAYWLGVGETRGVDWIRHAIQVGLAVLFVYLVSRARSTRAGAGGRSRAR
jgi:uncharacterized membrane protein YeaQ/YmgE (transglycosylase-associated protein family)